MTIKDFKEKTQATNIDKEILAQTIATFKNNEKYSNKIIWLMKIIVGT